MPDQSMTHTDGATTGAVKAGDADTEVKVMSSRTSADRPWLDHYPVADGWDMPLVPKPLYTLVDETAARIPDRIAIDFLGKTLTYGELLSAINEVAAGLQARGLKKGDRIGLLLPNTPYYVIMHYAILKAGGIVVNINPLYAEREIANLVRDSGLEMLATVDLAALYNKIVPLFDEGLKQIIVCPFTDVLPFPKNLLFRLVNYWFPTIPGYAGLKISERRRLI